MDQILLAIILRIGLGLALLLTSPGMSDVSKVSLRDNTLKVELQPGGKEYPVALTICEEQSFMDINGKTGRYFFGIGWFSGQGLLKVDKIHLDEINDSGTYEIEPESTYFEDDIRIEHIDLHKRKDDLFGPWSRKIAYVELLEPDAEKLRKEDAVVMVVMGNIKVENPCTVVFCKVILTKGGLQDSPFLLGLSCAVVLGVVVYLACFFPRGKARYRGVRLQ